MGEFTRIGSTSELPPEGEAREFNCGGQTICVAKANGNLAAIDNVCPHRGGPLGQGVVEGDKVVCPWHGWEFDLSSGALGHAPAHKLPTYELKIEGQEVFARQRVQAEDAGQ